MGKCDSTATVCSCMLYVLYIQVVIIESQKLSQAQSRVHTVLSVETLIDQILTVDV